MYTGQALYPVAGGVDARPVCGFRARDTIAILVVYSPVDQASG